MNRTLFCGAFTLLANAIAAQSLVHGASFPFSVPRPAGDVDGDGVDDYAGQVSGTAYVHSGATGLVIPHLTRTPSGFGGYTRCGDVDADGFDDLVLVSSTTLATLVSGANGATLRSWSTPAVGSMFTGAAPGADLDSDGCSDVILVASSWIEIYSGRTGALLTTQPNPTFGTISTELMVGDWNGDGHSDLAMTMQSVGALRLVLGPTFAPTVLTGGTPLAPNGPRVLGDVAGNGRSAIASPTVNPGQTTLLDGLGGAVIGLLPAATLRHFGDVDGDGRDDFQFLSSSYNPLLDGLTSGRTLTRLPSSISSHSVGTPSMGDLDGDGRQDGWIGSGLQYVIAHWVDPTVPVASRMVRRGASGATTTGSRPRLHARGHCSLGSTLRLDVRGLLPNGLSLLAFGSPVDVDLTPLGAPGNRLYTSLDGLSVLPTDATGLGQAVLPMPISTSVLGASVSLQAAAWEPAANPLGFVTSDALDLSVNN